MRRRPTARDVVRTSYIYLTLWLGVIFYLLLFGPFLIVANFTVDSAAEDGPAGGAVDISQSDSTLLLASRSFVAD